MHNIFNKAKILVIGDTMLDKYYRGKSNRTSPEANVPIVNITQIKYLVGGAGNAGLPGDV